MKKYLIIYAVIATAVIIFGGRMMWSEQQRHRTNSQALMESIHLYRTRADEAAASVQVLRLRCGEYEQACAGSVAREKDSSNS